MPLDTSTLPLHMAALIPGQVRITWDIAGVSGSGRWFHESDRSLLEDWCSELNQKYGAGTHTVETCGA